MSGARPILTVEHLGVSRGGRVLFSDLSFVLQPRCLITLNGRNGCGKTTLLDCISTIHRPSQGRIECNARRIARFPQNRAGFWNLTVSESIFVCLSEMSNAKALLGLTYSKATLKRKVEQCLIAVDLKDQADQEVYKLSGGMLQRLKFAQVLATDSDLVLLDEPFNDLDTLSTARECDIIRQILTKSAVVLVTHTHPPGIPEGQEISIEN